MNKFGECEILALVEPRFGTAEIPARNNFLIESSIFKGQKSR
jgi:hypothetical protein